MGQRRYTAHRTRKEVRMVEPGTVRQILALQRAGWGAKRISRELGLSRNTVRRYLRGGGELRPQRRPRRRRLTEQQVGEAVRLYEGAAECNAVVVQQMLAEDGVRASLRTIQRLVSGKRRELRARAVATVRFETAPGRQMQVDFGQKRVWIGGAVMVVYLLVATLSYSRRIFVQAFSSERGEDWREGIARAFRHFGGVTETVLSDNPRALVKGRERQTEAVVFDPGYLAFCRDWDVVPRACAPYRARTKGKVESGVKYVKRNALAGRDFPSFAALEEHLAVWIAQADRRVHGTTHQRPIERFELERTALRPLPEGRLVVRQRRLVRRVAADAMVDVDTVRYSVPHRLVRESVEVELRDEMVRILHHGQEVARHRRGREPHSRIVEPCHYDGLWKRQGQVAADPASQLPGVRHLAEYAAIVEAAR